jgi:hypothetical protein
MYEYSLNFLFRIISKVSTTVLIFSALYQSVIVIHSNNLHNIIYGFECRLSLSINQKFRNGKPHFTLVYSTKSGNAKEFVVAKAEFSEKQWKIGCFIEAVPVDQIENLSLTRLRRQEAVIP